MLGFLGVLIIANPHDLGWNIGVLAGVVSAISGGLVNIWLRRLSHTESTLAIAIYYNVISTLVCGTYVLLFTWDTPTSTQWLWILAFGSVGGLTQYFLTASFRYAEASLLAPLDYLSLIFAAVLGYLFWQEVPPWSTWIGAAIIAGSGLFVVYREFREETHDKQAAQVEEPESPIK